MTLDNCPHLSNISYLKFPFILEKDQIEAVNAWLNNNKRGSIIYSTGTGKTEIAFECARRLAINGNSNFKILFLVPRIVLIEQNIKRLMKYGIKKNSIGAYYGERKNVTNITFSTYQSIVRNFDLLRNANMVILDEVHLISLTAKKFSSIFSILKKDTNKAILGLTATINEDDPKYSEIITLIPPVKKYMIKEAVTDGRLTEPTITIRPVRMNSKENDDYEKISTAIKEISQNLRSSNPTEIKRLLKIGNYKSKLASEWFSKVQERKKLLTETSSKLNEAISIVKQHSNQRIMIFSETIESITKLNEMLRNENIKSEVIHNKVKTKQRKDILDKWGNAFYVLLSVHTLEIGFDIPSVSIAIIISNTQNIHQLVQRIGRVIRKSACKTRALIYVIYVEGTKDRKILKLIDSSLSEKANRDNKQKKISAFF